MPKDQSDLSDSPIEILSPVILSCVKLIVKANQDIPLYSRVQTRLGLTLSVGPSDNPSPNMPGSVVVTA